MNTAQTEAKKDFDRMVEGFEIEVLYDQELYRHLRFGISRNSIGRFDIITWPGCLCINGDMGCYVFSREPDMFTWFVDSGNRYNNEINPHYWSEKLLAKEKSGHLYVTDKDKVKRLVIEEFKKMYKEIMPDVCFTYEEKLECLEYIKNQIREDIYENINDDYKEVARILYDFNFHFNINTRHYNFAFENAWEWGEYIKEFSRNFLVCCYSIVYGIKKYNEFKGI